MRKRRAIILFSTLILLIVGYVMWCARPFYLKPPLNETIKSTSGISAEDYKVIREWYADSELIEPLEFSWAKMGELLQKPWGGSVIPSVIMVIQSSDKGGRLESIYLIVVVHGKSYYKMEGRSKNGGLEWERLAS